VTSPHVRHAERQDRPGLRRARLRRQPVGKSAAKERKKGCTKQLTPGAAAGGCAFDGAKIALQPIVDVAHLVHGPIACEGNSWDNRHSASSGPQTYRTGFTTDITEFDVIYGGEKRLFKAIREIIEKTGPAGGLRLPDLRHRR
jgi:nitrogenase molybdenum-cofactor synthesis protein NifE